MKQKILVYVFHFSLLTFHYSFSQVWHVLPASPEQPWRNDDLFFINSTTGWVVNIRGEIWKTTDGGTTWRCMVRQPTAFRCIGFLDTLHGFVGNLGPSVWNSNKDETPLYKTIDGGKTWLPVNDYMGPKPAGLCGMQIVNDSVIVACGRVDGPAYFIKSVDGGNRWRSYNISNYCGMAIDIYFTSSKKGFIAGGTDKSRLLSSSVVIETLDGGNTWKTLIRDSSKQNHCWKITHPSKNTFFISIEELFADNPLKYFKSSDNGKSWQEETHKDIKYGYSQGIGFVDNEHGWIGGSANTLFTSDGGKTFSKMPENFNNINRFRFLNDTLGYAAGKKIYKYCK